jgi:hypothetical protein
MQFHSLLRAAVSALSLALGIGIAFGKDQGNTAPVIIGTVGPRPPSMPSSVPHLSGTSGVHSGVGQYRPIVVTNAGGIRTYVYPATHNSTVLHLAGSSLANSNPSTGIQHAGNSRNSAALVSPRVANRHTGVNGNGSSGNLPGKGSLDPQTSARIRNWKGNPNSFAQAQQKHADHCHHHHDHDWWKNHCFAFVFFDWGFWAWDAGWWYPAWGYDPYSSYEYNEPIYGYSGLSPDEIVADVQSALQLQGYYSYAVDGRMGPLTKSAIANYQRDHRLPITYAIDPATLGSLGLIAP